MYVLEAVTRIVLGLLQLPLIMLLRLLAKRGSEMTCVISTATRVATPHHSNWKAPFSVRVRAPATNDSTSNQYNVLCNVAQTLPSQIRLSKQHDDSELCKPSLSSTHFTCYSTNRACCGSALPANGGVKVYSRKWMAVLTATHCVPPCLHSHAWTPAAP